MALFNDIAGANGAVPDRDFITESKLRVSQAQFGDGYSQRFVDGLINPESKTYNLKFSNRSNTEINAITSFLKSRSGYQAFDWIPPGDSTAVYVVCSRWDVTYVTNSIKSLNMTFEEVKDPTLKPTLVFA